MNRNFLSKLIKSQTVHLGVSSGPFQFPFALGEAASYTSLYFPYRKPYSFYPTSYAFMEDLHVLLLTQQGQLTLTTSSWAFPFERQLVKFALCTFFAMKQHQW